MGRTPGSRKAERYFLLPPGAPMPLSPTAAHDLVSDLLDQQAARRARHIPVLSVLAGPLLAGLRRWNCWLTGCRRPSVVTPLTGPADVARLLLITLAQHRDLAGDALAAVAGWWGRTPAELRAKLDGLTGADLDLFLEGLPVDRARDPVAVATLLIRWRQQGLLRGTDPFTDQVGTALGWPKPDELRVLAALAALAPEGEWPSLFLADDVTGSQLAWLARASRTAVALATRLPRLQIGLAVPHEVLSEHLRTAAESQALALLREGVIALPPAYPEELSAGVEEAGFAAAAAPLSVGALLARCDPGLAARLAEVASAVAALDASDEAADEQARSLAERFLFDLLEGHPATAGLFELNGILDFPFGPRAAEVDLLARSLHLAVELDGRFWHLRDPECYRRDRRKDWELQRHGFLVLRFLAEDVAVRLQDILDTTLAAVEYRRQADSAGGHW